MKILRGMEKARKDKPTYEQRMEAKDESIVFLNLTLAVAIFIAILLGFWAQKAKGAGIYYTERTNAQL